MSVIQTTARDIFFMCTAGKRKQKVKSVRFTSFGGQDKQHLYFTWICYCYKSLVSSFIAFVSYVNISLLRHLVLKNVHKRHPLFVFTFVKDSFIARQYCEHWGSAGVCAWRVASKWRSASKYPFSLVTFFLSSFDFFSLTLTYETFQKTMPLKV